MEKVPVIFSLAEGCGRIVLAEGVYSLQTEKEIIPLEELTGMTALDVVEDLGKQRKSADIEKACWWIETHGSLIFHGPFHQQTIFARFDTKFALDNTRACLQQCKSVQLLEEEG